MIRLEHTVLPSAEQMEFVIEGMRNPMNSWDRSDSFGHNNLNPYKVGDQDLLLMQRLANNGPVHAKYRRMIPVYVRITAPLYWWKEFDTYKIGTVTNSCSTMHKIHEKEFKLSDFSWEHLQDCELTTVTGISGGGTPMMILEATIDILNYYRKCYLEDGKQKDDWWQLIQLLPSGYNQTRNVMLNYEVLANMYESRKYHRLDEWREFCVWIESLPHSQIICYCGESMPGDE